ncbi:hypothetical protein CR513_21455, partial [Mucuna pruriens]
MTVMKNQHNELVPMRIQNSWRVCINYRRLNQANLKDQATRIDQVLEKLAGKSHYYFLDDFFGYMQIHIALKDQHKTIFTCPFGPAKLSPPSEAQAESLSARPRLGPCREPSQEDPGGTPRQQSEPPWGQLSSTSLPGVACNASHSKGRIGIVHGLLAFKLSRVHNSKLSRSLLLRSRLRTERPKVIRGDRLEHQRTLVDLNLSVLAS